MIKLTYVTKIFPILVYYGNCFEGTDFLTNFSEDTDRIYREFSDNIYTRKDKIGILGGICYSLNNNVERIARANPLIREIF